MAAGGKDEMSENPRIGKVLRIPIEIVTEDETKVEEMIKKMADSKGMGSGGMDDVAEAEKIIEQTKMGDLLTLGKEHIGNLLSFAKNPAGMMLSVFLRKFAKGAGALALAFILLEAIKFGLEYLTRDGMPWDRRFRRYIQNEVLAFLDRMIKAQLRQGFRSVITTTIGGLRGGQGQVSGNLFDLSAGRNNKIPFNQYAIPIDTGLSKGMTQSVGGLAGLARGNR